MSNDNDSALVDLLRHFGVEEVDAVKSVSSVAEPSST